ncbi:class I SAM-dependent methyltransferase [Thermomonas aquatica]|uniref:Methyltransferase domain-containing protein n=1 Tax=Thermomonas aquatica TaxID=2202149 RepID=A0A5B7ZNU1_9GAMM|nr:class I SAM-dependent methyltransferase [Thermomonas aquatica]QDA56851.1 methyltransferase domain-containing protein [Thermomonas aquatica]
MATSDANACNVCRAPLGTALYRSIDGQSLTSLCRQHPSTTEVFACMVCGHLQTRAIQDIDAFYDHDYDILVDSEEEDQIYEMRDGAPIYRTAHQVRVLRETLGDIAGPLLLLDYGCAKSSTIRTLCAQEPGIVPHLYDVSSRYESFWSTFVPRENCAIKRTPASWQERFDLVTSFFSLEHIPNVADTLGHIASLMRPGGRLYAVVPNVLTNIADFVVVDHCNHFTAPSLAQLVAAAGLITECIDDMAHRGAFVLLARKPEDGLTPAAPNDRAGVERACTELSSLASFWRDAGGRVREFERVLPIQAQVAIYGAGFYGAFLRSSLACPERVACHLDNNPFLHGQSFDHKPILPPERLPAELDAVLIGLNPAHARQIIADIPALARPGLKLFFL